MRKVVSTVIVLLVLVAITPLWGAEYRAGLSYPQGNRFVTNTLSEGPVPPVTTGGQRVYYWAGYRQWSGKADFGELSGHITSFYGGGYGQPREELYTGMTYSDVVFTCDDPTITSVSYRFRLALNISAAFDDIDNTGQPS